MDDDFNAKIERAINLAKINPPNKISSKSKNMMQKGEVNAMSKGEPVIAISPQPAQSPNITDLLDFSESAHYTHANGDTLDHNTGSNAQEIVRENQKSASSNKSSSSPKLSSKERQHHSDSTHNMGFKAKQYISAESEGTRRSPLLSGLAAETVSFLSTYQNRHISSSEQYKRNGESSALSSSNSSPTRQTSTQRSAMQVSSIPFPSEKIPSNSNANVSGPDGQHTWSLDRSAPIVAPSAKSAHGHVRRTEPMHIALRVRPLTQSEISGGVRQCVSVSRSDARKLVLANPSVPVFDIDQLTAAVDAQALFSRDIATTHSFDSIFTSNKMHGHLTSEQQEVYENVGAGMVQRALNGISSICCAYGEPKSGKSYSIFGEPNGGDASSGLLPRVFAEVVQRAHATGDTKCTLSFIEIHNDKVQDLLGSCEASTTSASQGHKQAQSRSIHVGVKGALSASGHSHSNHQGLVFANTHRAESHNQPRVELRVREHPQLGPFVDGMRKLRVHSAADVMAVIREAQAERTWLHTTTHTHADCCTVLATLELTPLHNSAPHRAMGGTTGGQQLTPAVRVHMVDLAATLGEMVANTRTVVKGKTVARSKDSTKSSFEDPSGASINLSGAITAAAAAKRRDEVRMAKKDLANLNHVLHCLERGAALQTIPFRDSILTWLLRSTLVSPSSALALIAHISPGECAYDDTCRVLKYAERLIQARQQKIGTSSVSGADDTAWQATTPGSENRASEVNPAASSSPATTQKARFVTAMKSTSITNASATMVVQAHKEPWKKAYAASLKAADIAAATDEPGASDNEETAALRTALHNMQDALENSRFECDALRVENDMLIQEHRKLADRLKMTAAREQALQEEVELLGSALFDALQGAQQARVQSQTQLLQPSTKPPNLLNRDLMPMQPVRSAPVRTVNLRDPPSAFPSSANDIGSPEPEAFRYNISSGALSPEVPADDDVPDTTEAYFPASVEPQGVPKFVTRPFVTSEEDMIAARQRGHSPQARSLSAPVSPERREAAASPKGFARTELVGSSHVASTSQEFDKIGDAELDEQISKMSKFLVRDKNAARARPKGRAGGGGVHTSSDTVDDDL